MTSHPPTPHRRPNSANSFHGHYSVDPKSLPLDSVMGGGALEELSDGMATLDANMQHLQAVHENLSRFSESFSAFLYGIKMNAWCVEFSEAPSGESFQRDRSTIEEQPKPEEATSEETKEADADTTYMTNDNQSFIVQPPKPTPRQTQTRQSRIPSSSSRTTTSQQRTSGIPRQTGIPRKTTTSAAKARQMAQERAKKSQWR
ncbi:hypothetical protein TRICI_003194 [Trichomonascus ciferrii]|uniref:DASH complex subunit DAM1 n=1 Tax=Trichomonascus ciferrii TaxID=44093 RepID=A0A642V9M3_9ASCO|nr:hypothetical protein TRICI_003194 [Trichomonascus ciferrii]